MNNKNSLIFSGLFVFFLVLFGIGFWQIEKNSDEDTVDKKLQEDMALGLTDVPIEKAFASAASAPADQSQVQSQVNPLSSNQAAQPADAPTLDAKTPDTPADNSKESENLYKSEKFGIEFEKPSSDYVVDENNNSSISISKGTKKITIKIFDNIDKKDLQPWFNGHYNDKKNKGCAFTDATDKIGAFDTKNVSVSSTPLASTSSSSQKCLDDGLYAINSDKTKVFKAIRSDQSDADLKKLMGSIKMLDKS